MSLESGGDGEMYRPTATELRVLQAIKKLGEGDRMAVGSESGLGSELAESICKYLSLHGLVESSTGEVARRVGLSTVKRRYALTPKGLAMLEPPRAR